MKKARQALTAWRNTGRRPTHSTARACGTATGEVLKRLLNLMTEDHYLTPHLTFDVRGGRKWAKPA